MNRDQLAALTQRVFSAPEATEWLREFEKAHHAGKSAFGPDARRTDFILGQQSAVLWVRDLLQHRKDKPHE